MNNSTRNEKIPVVVEVREILPRQPKEGSGIQLNPDYTGRVVELVTEEGGRKTRLQLHMLGDLIEQ